LVHYSEINQCLKKKNEAGQGGLPLQFPPAWEAEFKKVTIPDQLGKKLARFLSK
jgi:hypothetical protein